MPEAPYTLSDRTISLVLTALRLQRHYAAHLRLYEIDSIEETGAESSLRMLVCGLDTVGTPFRYKMRQGLADFSPVLTAERTGTTELLVPPGTMAKSVKRIYAQLVATPATRANYESLFKMFLGLPKRFKTSTVSLHIERDSSLRFELNEGHAAIAVLSSSMSDQTAINVSMGRHNFCAICASRDIAGFGERRVAALWTALERVDR